MHLQKQQVRFFTNPQWEVKYFNSGRKKKTRCEEVSGEIWLLRGAHPSLSLVMLTHGDVREVHPTPGHVLH